jgi:sRNA-binding carbon storage regulator CsrA
MEGDSIMIFPSDEIPEGMTVEELFANGPIEIKVGRVRESRNIRKMKVEVGIAAPKELSILRDSLYYAEVEEKQDVA